MFSLDMLDYPMYSLSSSTWNFLCWMGWGDHSKSVLLFGFLCETPPSCSKVMGGWWWWVGGGWLVGGGGGGLQDFSVSPGSGSLSLSLSKSLSEEKRKNLYSLKNLHSAEYLEIKYKITDSLLVCFMPWINKSPGFHISPSLSEHILVGCDPQCRTPDERTHNNRGSGTHKTEQLTSHTPYSSQSS